MKPLRARLVTSSRGNSTSRWMPWATERKKPLTMNWTKSWMMPCAPHAQVITLEDEGRSRYKYPYSREPQGARSSQRSLTENRFRRARACHVAFPAAGGRTRSCLSEGRDALETPSSRDRGVPADPGKRVGSGRTPQDGQLS